MHYDLVAAGFSLRNLFFNSLLMRSGEQHDRTTSSFGVIGGHEHEAVRKAAQEYVKVAGQYYANSKPVSDYPYPESGKVNFFFLTYDGVRLCIGDEDGINNGSDQTTPLFAAAQDVLTALQDVAEPMMKENGR